MHLGGKREEVKLSQRGIEVMCLSSSAGLTVNLTFYSTIMLQLTSWMLQTNTFEVQWQCRRTTKFEKPLCVCMPAADNVQHSVQVKWSGGRGN